MIKHFFIVIWVCFVLIVLNIYTCVGQGGVINNCEGAVDVSGLDEINASFEGLKGVDRSAWSSIVNKEMSKNTVWFRYSPDFNGTLRLNCRVYLDSFDLVILKTKNLNPCEDIRTGLFSDVFIKTSTSCSHLDSLQIDVDINYTYFFIYHAQEKNESNVYLGLDFEKNENSIQNKIKPLILNLVYTNDLNTYCLYVVDDEYFQPVPARISIINTQQIDGAYQASNLLLNVPKSFKQGSVNVDAKGYLSYDIDDFNLTFGSQKVIRDTIYLKKIRRGVVAKIDNIYFEAGSPNILDASIEKIIRLKDFLRFNPTVKIEIQGHVNIEKGNRRGKSLSKKRAKKIIQILVDMGINKTRLSARGFGGTRPIYANPKNEEEKEANRRVEIKIK